MTFHAKLQMGPKPLRFRFDKIDDRIRYLVLLDNEWFDKIFDTIKYLISEQSGIKVSIIHNFGNIRFDSFNFLPTGKLLTFQNVLMLIKSVVNKNKYKY